MFIAMNRFRVKKGSEEAFEQPGWRRNFGGYSWKMTVRVLRPYLDGSRKPRIFVDQCFNLQHNTGSILNKLYNCSKLPEVLEAHGADDYPTLLRHASPEVRRRWRRQDYLQRADHDPVWTGQPDAHRSVQEGKGVSVLPPADE